MAKSWNGAVEVAAVDLGTAAPTEAVQVRGGNRELTVRPEWGV